METTTPRAKRPVLGFVICAAFAVCVGWLVFDGISNPSRQPVVDHVETGAIK